MRALTQRENDNVIQISETFSARRGRSAADNPNTEHITFAIDNRDHAIWRNSYRAGDSVIDDGLDIGHCKWINCHRRWSRSWGW